MSKQDRLSILRLRFAALAVSCASAQAAPSASFTPIARLPIMAQRADSGAILSRAERMALARELAPRRAFLADVAALPLRLMPAPFFLPAL